MDDQKLENAVSYLSDTMETGSTIDIDSLHSRWRSDTDMEDNYLISGLEIMYRNGAYGITENRQLRASPDTEVEDDFRIDENEFIEVESVHRLDEDEIEEFSRHFRKYFDTPEELGPGRGRISFERNIETGDRRKEYKLERIGGETFRQASISMRAPVINLSDEVNYLVSDIKEGIREDYRAIIGKEEEQRFSTLKQRA